MAKNQKRKSPYIKVHKYYSKFNMKKNDADSSKWRLTQVPPVSLGKLKPSDFADDELDLLFYLVHLHEVAKIRNLQ